MVVHVDGCPVDGCPLTSLTLIFQSLYGISLANFDLVRPGRWTSADLYPLLLCLCLFCLPVFSKSVTFLRLLVTIANFAIVRQVHWTPADINACVLKICDLSASITTVQADELIRAIVKFSDCQLLRCSKLIKRDGSFVTLRLNSNPFLEPPTLWSPSHTLWLQQVA